MSPSTCDTTNLSGYIILISQCGSEFRRASWPEMLAETRTVVHDIRIVNCSRPLITWSFNSSNFAISDQNFTLPVRRRSRASFFILPVCIKSSSDAVASYLVPKHYTYNNTTKICSIQSYD